MQWPTKMTNEVLDQVHEIRLQGLTFNEIAKTIGNVHPETVRRAYKVYVMKQDANIRKAWRKKWNALLGWE